VAVLGSSVVFLFCLLAGTALARGTATASAAAVAGDVQFDQSAYTVHENVGWATFNIVRSGDLSQVEHVGFGAKQMQNSAEDGIDFDSVNPGYVEIPAGQSSVQVRVRVIDNGINAQPLQFKIYLYSAYPQPLGANSNAIVTILRDDPLDPRNAANPLGVPGPYNGNLIAGAKLYVDPQSPAAQARQQYLHSNPKWASLLGDIADAPGAHRFYMWNMGDQVEGQVAHYLQGTQLQEPGTTVMISTYNLVHDGCGYTATPAIQQMYDNFMKDVAAGIGNFHVIFFLEFDSLITTPCLSRSQLAIREAELRYAVSVLEQDPHVLVYLDGGAADAISADRMATLLRDSGVGQAQGFFLNSTHFDWTARELSYGETISKKLGGAHFVINTGENGRGPLVPKDRVHHGNEVLCNPPGRGLGPLSVNGAVAQQTGYANADGFLWFSNPGGSGGQCVPGAPPTGQFWPAYAVMLAENWVDKVTGPSGGGSGKHHKKHHKHHKHKKRHHKRHHKHHRH
jgi:endoglucanase